MNARNPGEAAQVGRYPPCTHTYRRIADAHALDFIAAHRNRARLRGICILSATTGPTRWPTASQQKPRIGVQVKIQSFTVDDARRIRQTGFDLVRFGVWTDRLDRDDYRRQVDEAFAAARSAHLPVLLTVRALAPFGQADGKSTGNDQTAMLAAAGARLADTVGNWPRNMSANSRRSKCGTNPT